MTSDESRSRDPFRLLIPILLILFVPLAHGTITGVELLTRGWVMAGMGGAFFAIMMLVSGVRLQAFGRTDPLATAAWFLLIAYLLHQTEEHGIDLLGRTYAFLGYGNMVLAERFPDGSLQLTELAIYRINTLLVWVPFLLAIWAGRRLPWVGLAAAGLMLANGAFHIFIAFERGEYNPGLATAIVFFLPLSLTYLSRSYREAGTGLLAILVAIAYGVAGHAVLPMVIAEASAPDWTESLIGLFALIALAPLFANLVYRIAGRG